MTRVSFLDKTYVVVSLCDSALIGELRDRVSWCLRLPWSHARCFDLYASTSGLLAGRELGREELVSSFEGEKLVYAARQICDGLVGARRRKATMRLLFAQAVFCVRSGAYACGPEAAVLLGSLQLRAALNLEEVDCDKEEKSVSDVAEDALGHFLHIAELVPRPLLASRAQVDWEQSVLAAVRGDENTEKNKGFLFRPINEQRQASDLSSAFLDTTSEIKKKKKRASSSSSGGSFFNISPEAKEKKGRSRGGDAYRARYLDVVERWPCYGVDVFACAEVAVYVSDTNEKRQVRSRGDLALGVSRRGLALLVAKSETTTESAGRFFEKGSLAVDLDLATIQRWGTRANVAFYFDLQGPEQQQQKTDVIEALRSAGDAPPERDPSPHFDGLQPEKTRNDTTLRLVCLLRHAAKVASLLREFAFARLDDDKTQHRRRSIGLLAHDDDDTDDDDDDKSTTDDDDDDDENDDNKRRVVLQTTHPHPPKSNNVAQEKTSDGGKPQVKAVTTQSPQTKNLDTSSATRIANACRGKCLDWKRSRAALTLQSLWRGSLLRMRVSSFMNEKSHFLASQSDREEAALLLHAVARGALARRRLLLENNIAAKSIPPSSLSTSNNTHDTAVRGLFFFSQNIIIRSLFVRRRRSS